MRMRFFDRCPGTLGRTLSSEQRLERELYPNADPGDPDAGEPIRDEGAARKQAEAIINTTRESLGALGFTCEISISPEKELTPMERFKAASDARWNPRPATADAVDTSKMTPMERFKAASNARWGIA